MARPALIAAFTLPFAIAALPLIAVFATNGTTPANDAVTYVPAPITIADEETAAAALALSANEFMPDLMVKFSQMVKRGDLQGGMWAGSLGVTIPLWFIQKQAFGVREMKLELDEVRAERRMKEQSVALDIRDSLARATANWKLLRLYDGAFIPQAEEMVRAALKSYEAGAGDFLNLLDSQRTLIEFRNERARASMGLSAAVADLERAAGREIR